MWPFFLWVTTSSRTQKSDPYALPRSIIRVSAALGSAAKSVHRLHTLFSVFKPTLTYNGCYRAKRYFPLFRTLIVVDPPQMKHIPRILSLDGGGVRGLSTLLILRDIMEEIGRRTGTSGSAKPCDYFDLIGGTSTGGLIAIMLGLLGMVCSL